MGLNGCLLVKYCFSVWLEKMNDTGLSFVVLITSDQVYLFTDGQQFELRKEKIQANIHYK